MGRRLDGRAEKFIGLRPDCKQDGTEQLEWGFEGAEFDGNKAEVRPDDILVWNFRQRCRMLLTPPAKCTTFRVVFRLHLTGLRVEARDGEFWIFSTIDGGFRFRIRRPAVIDPLTKDPVCDLDGTPIECVRHSLVKDGDSWLYVKDSTEAFAKAATDGRLSAGWLLDADTYYSTTADGYVFLSNSVWSTVHNGSTGSSSSTSDSTKDNAIGVGLTISYGIFRSFFLFDTTAANTPVSARFLAKTYQNNNSDVCVQEGTQGDSLTTADYDAFTGEEFGHVTWGADGTFNEISFNELGISKVNTEGITYLCAREYSHDYMNYAPEGANYNGVYYANRSGVAEDPYLSITEPYQPQVMIIS
ncbi:MAG: hypothetical protein LLG20_01875 [Acidobacteriales bacterium]|nr:hypothetical protein [Terriglobales bacterium]